jgi:hypothetical protein
MSSPRPSSSRPASIQSPQLPRNQSLPPQNNEIEQARVRNIQKAAYISLEIVPQVLRELARGGVDAMWRDVVDTVSAAEGEFSKVSRSDCVCAPAKCCTSCPLCKAVSEYMRSTLHVNPQNGKINFFNSDCQRWFDEEDGRFEMAKLLVPNMGKKPGEKKDLEDFDTSTLANLLLQGKIFVESEAQTRVIEAVRESRNFMAHINGYGLDDRTTESVIEEALDLINLPAVPPALADGWRAQVDRISREGVNVGEAAGLRAKFEAFVREELESSRQEIGLLREELSGVHDKLDRILAFLEKGTAAVADKKPPRPLNPYTLYVKTHSAAYHAQHPEATGAQRMTAIAQMWASAPENPKNQVIKAEK